MERPALQLNEPYDLRFMAAILRLALRHNGMTGGNPCVGALLVRFDACSPHVIGRGVTAAGGRPHAEVLALAGAGPGAKGATLYVTLEPCSHYGATPPCAEAIVKSGVTRVVAAMEDLDPRVAGQGFEALKKAGIALTTGVLLAEARRAHAAHICRVLKDRPHIFLKMAVSADGYIGVRQGPPAAISVDEAWHYTHLLRAMSGGILVGAGTVTADNPRLTCRLPGLEKRSPVRLVWCNKRTLPCEAQILKGQELARTHIIKADTPEKFLSRLKQLEPDLQTLMIEGGAATARSFLQAGLVDAVYLIRAQKALSAPPGEGVAAPLKGMCDESVFERVERRALGADTLEIYWRKDF